LGASILAIKSVEPPGGNGTTKVTGLFGQANALLMLMDAINPKTNFFIFIFVSLKFK
jgi:hypothetical protein